MVERIPIRVGLIGCGNYGRKVQLANLLAVPTVRVTGLFNRSKESLEAAKRDARAADQEPRTFSTWQQLVADTNVDAVVAAMPPEFNWAIVKACEAAGKAVLIEKPVATSLDDLHAIETLARKRKVHVQVGTQLLWSQFYRRLEEETRALGEVLSVRCEVYHGDSWPLQPMTWKVDSASSGGILNSWGIHPVTMMLKLAGGTAIGDRPACDGSAADYDELTAFTGCAFERDGVDPAMYDTVSATWVTLGPGDSDAAVPCHLLYCAHPQVTSAVWRVDAVCTGGRIEGDVHARTLKVMRRGQAVRDVPLPPIAGAGYDGNREALEFFADCITRRRVDLGSLQLGATASRLALEVNVNPENQDESDDSRDDATEVPRPNKHRMHPRNPNDAPRGRPGGGRPRR